MTIKVSGLPTHYILVDYDNLAKNLRVNVSNILSNFAYVVKALDAQSDFFDGIANDSCVQILLYGGWFSGSKKTRLAEDLVKEISCDSEYSSYKLESQKRIRICARLAYGLASMRDRAFLGTFRRYAPNIRINDSIDPCCKDMDELITRLGYYLHHDARCIGCLKVKKEMFYAEGQKLVDTMLACDLQHYASNVENKVALVTSDDDLIPPLFQQAVLTRNVYHVLSGAESNYCYETFYLPMRPSFYKYIYLKEGCQNG